jgi:phosphatidylinositol-3,4,5-trisphosphate 3-phosphatase/dual-specificity protein phosphatase PTEN
MRLIRLHWWIILAQYKMFNFVKKLVAGPKKMMEFEGNHLDLTHITERIIAMAFPACSTLEKIYRNSISDVADYLNSQYNGNYLIINVSNRTYDYSKFEDKVKDFEWHDHQAPSLTTLIDIGFSMFNFLQSSRKLT